MSASVAYPSPAASSLLAEFAAVPEILVALDFDGTVALLDDQPMRVRALPETKLVLENLRSQRGVSVAFVSGRSMADLLIISEADAGGAASGFYLAGSHGAELKLPDRPQSGALTAQEQELVDHYRLISQQLIAEVPEAWVEAKSMGFAVHFRRCSAADRLRVTQILATSLDRELSQWRRRSGHDIVEYAVLDTGKDAAVAILKQLSGAKAVLFAGDDTTDEDALRSLGDLDLGIRVGDAETAAKVRVRTPQQLSELLAELFLLRESAFSK